MSHIDDPVLKRRLDKVALKNRMTNESIYEMADRLASTIHIDDIPRVIQLAIDLALVPRRLKEPETDVPWIYRHYEAHHGKRHPYDPREARL